MWINTKDKNNNIAFLDTLMINPLIIDHRAVSNNYRYEIQTLLIKSMEQLAEIQGCAEIRTINYFADDQVLIDMNYKWKVWNDL